MGTHSIRPVEASASCYWMPDVGWLLGTSFINAMTGASTIMTNEITPCKNTNTNRKKMLFPVIFVSQRVMSMRVPERLITFSNIHLEVFCHDLLHEWASNLDKNAWINLAASGGNTSKYGDEKIYHSKSYNSIFIFYFISFAIKLPYTAHVSLHILNGWKRSKTKCIIWSYQ